MNNSGSSQNLSTEESDSKESDYDEILESDDEAVLESPDLSKNLGLENSKSEIKVQICPHCNETCKGHLKQHVIVCKIYYR